MLIVKVSISLMTSAWGTNLMVSAWIQLRKLAYRIVNSSTLLLPKWKKHLAALKIEERLMLRDVRMRWNLTFKMLEFAMQHRKPLDLLCGDRANGLRDLELKPEEWRIAGQLRDVLKVRLGAESQFPFSITSHNQVFLNATLFFSRGTPNLATVIPAMDHIDMVLALQSVDRQYDPAIRAALAMAKKTLSRYYTLTDSSETYHIAMGTLIHLHTDYLTRPILSPPSPSQTHLLCQGKVGTGLDRNGS
jgi:hypothetical protein